VTIGPDTFTVAFWIKVSHLFLDLNASSSRFEKSWATHALSTDVEGFSKELEHLRYHGESIRERTKETYVGYNPRSGPRHSGRILSEEPRVTSSDNLTIPLRVGAKAGLCVGPVLALTNIAIDFTVLNYGFSSGNVYAAGYPIPVAYFLIAEMIIGAIAFAVIGVLFLRFRRYLLGYTMTEKGMCATLLLWVAVWLQRLGQILMGQIVFRNGLLLASLMLSFISFAAAGSGLGLLTQKFAK